MRLPPYSIHEGKGNLEIRFRWGGQHKSLSAGTRNRKEAEAIAAGILDTWIRSRKAPAISAPIENAATEFLREQYADKKPDTCTEVRNVLKRLLAAFPNKPSLNLITPEVFREAVPRLRGEASPKYWVNILIICRKFLRWAVTRKYLAEDPTVGIPLPSRSTFGRREEVWPDADFNLLVSAVKPLDAEILMLMRWAGMDSGDIFKLRPVHFVFDGQGSRVIKKLREKAKTDDEMIIQPLSSRLRFIEARLSNPLMYSVGYASMKSFTASLLTRVRSVMLKMGLPPRDLKSLRHTYATYHANRDVPIDVLRRWLGHAPDSRVLERVYLHRASTSRYMD